MASHFESFEAILKKLSVQCNGKFINIASVVEDALLCLPKAPFIADKAAICTIREKILGIVELCLESQCDGILNSSFSLLQELADLNKIDPTSVLSQMSDQDFITQVVYTFHNLPSWFMHSTLQCQCFTAILNYVSNPGLFITASTAKSILELSISTYCTPLCKPDARIAARATVMQCTTLCCQKWKDNNAILNAAGISSENVTGNEIIELLSVCCDKLKSITSSSDTAGPLILVLDAIYAILMAQDPSCIDTRFVDVMWQEVIPLIVTVLGDPNESILPSHNASDPCNSIEQSKGRGLTGAAFHVKYVQNISAVAHMICDECLRILGPNGQMRSSLQALFHRFLLFRRPVERQETLCSLKHILENPSRILCFIYLDHTTMTWDFKLYRMYVLNYSQFFLCEYRNGAKIHIFLSSHVFLNFPINPLLHMAKVSHLYSMIFLFIR